MENISTCPETLGIKEIMNPKPFQRRKVVDSGEEEETPDGTIAKRLRKKRKVKYAQEAEREMKTKMKAKMQKEMMKRQKEKNSRLERGTKFVR